MKICLPKRLSNTAGFSLIEGLVGVGLIAGLAVMVAQFGMQSKPAQKIDDSRTCDSVAQGALDALKRRGMYTQIFHVNPLAADRSLGAAFSHTPLVPDAHLWPATDDYRVNVPGGVGTFERSYAGWALVDGYMKSIAAIYNTNPAGFCGSWQNYASFNITALGITTNLGRDTNNDGRNDAAPNLFLRIRPFDTRTGQTIACNVLRPVPPASPTVNAFAVPTGAFNNAALATDGQASPAFTNTNRINGIARNIRLFETHAASGLSATVGFEVSTRVEYSTFEGRNTGVIKNCEASQRFQYVPDVTPPPQPTISAGGNNSPPRSFALTNASARTFNVSISYSGTERGVQLFCRDRSRRMEHNTLGSGYNDYGAPCFHGGANVGIWGIPQNTNGPLVGNNDWVPCDRVTACGATPSASRVGTIGSAPGLNLSYAITNWPCDVIIDVIAIDAAGNRSDLSSLVRNSFGFTNSNSAPNDSVIRKPYCGQPNASGQAAGTATNYGFHCRNTTTAHWSGAYATGNWTASYPNGYYTTRAGGCCVTPAAPYVPGSNGPTGPPAGACTPR